MACSLDPNTVMSRQRGGAVVKIFRGWTTYDGHIHFGQLMTYASLVLQGFLLRSEKDDRERGEIHMKQLLLLGYNS